MNDVAEIDKSFGVPGKSKYTFDKLQVGTAMKFADLTMYQQLRSAASRQGRKLKRKFSVRLIDEQDKKTGQTVRKIAVVRVK